MSKNPIADDVRDEYDFTPSKLRTGKRGKYAARYAEGVNIVRLDPDVAAVFPDSESVNEAPASGSPDSSDVEMLLQIIRPDVAGRLAHNGPQSAGVQLAMHRDGESLLLALSGHPT